MKHNRNILSKTKKKGFLGLDQHRQSQSKMQQLQSRDAHSQEGLLN